MANEVRFDTEFSGNWETKVPSTIYFGPRNHPRKGSVSIHWRVSRREYESVVSVIKPDGKVSIITPKAIRAMAGHLEEDESGEQMLVITDQEESEEIYRMQLPSIADYASEKFISKATVTSAQQWIELDAQNPSL